MKYKQNLIRLEIGALRTRIAQVGGPAGFAARAGRSQGWANWLIHRVNHGHRVTMRVAGNVSTALGVPVQEIERLPAQRKAV